MDIARKAAVLIMGVLLGLLGCAKATVKGYFKPGVTVSHIRSIALVPFDNISGHPDAGKKVVNLFLTKLVRTTLFEIADVGEVEKSLRGLRIRTTAEIDLSKLKTLGEQLNIQAIMVGSVDEYEVRQEEGEAIPVVAMSARILEVPTGRILWAVSHTHDGDDWETLFGFGKIISLSQLADIVVSEMVESLVEELKASSRAEGIAKEVPVKAVVADRDGDGIPDELDQCPDGAETFNGYEDEDGCPDEVPPPPPPVAVEKPPMEERVVPRVPAVRLSCSKRVLFAADSYKLDETARTILDEAAACLKADPEARMDIRGYADSVEPGGPNRWLSGKRAERVRDYLVSQGIGIDRLRIMRYGEDYPLVRNKTREGRAQNRRVDLVRVFALEGIHFETDEGELRLSAMAILDQVVKVLEEFPRVMIEIGGHADVRGTVWYNQRLSEQRAQAVQDYLVKQGIEAVRLKRVGYGELYPVDPRRNPEAWAQNRRVEIVEWLPAK